MGRFLIWLSGARRQILAECPTERPKYVGIGAAILITAAMAGVSLSFALVTILKVPLPDVLPFAIAWGLAILSLDRLFVVSMSRQGPRWAHLSRALPRVLLALLLGAVISTPFVLQIFRPEIDQEITILQQQAANAHNKQVATSKLAARITQEQARVDTLESQQATGGPGVPLAADKTLQNLTGQLQQAQTRMNNDYAELQCQLYGLPGPNGTKCVAGDGQQAERSKAAYKNDVDQVNLLQGEIKTREGQLNAQSQSLQARKKAQATAELPAARLALNTDLSQQQQDINTFDIANKNDTGLLIRLKALDAVTKGNSTLNWARWLLFALFVVIDCMPVMIKVMLNLGPENNYDRMLAGEEKKQLRVASSNRAVRQANEITETITAIDEGRSRIAGWNTELPDVRDDIIETRRRVERERLRSWEMEQLRQIKAGQYFGNAGNGLHQEPPTTLLEWPWIAGSAVRSRARMSRVRWRASLRGLPVRLLRPGSARHRTRRQVQEPYGAPFSPRMQTTPNGSVRPGP